MKEATPGQILLDIKRAGVFKARGVKQGFKEDRELADGPDFNYYAHVAELVSVRTVLFRMDRGTRRIAIKDVRTAFLQSYKYPPGCASALSIPSLVNRLTSDNPDRFMEKHQLSFDGKTQLHLG